jgi:hypothetical protein
MLEWCKRKHRRIAMSVEIIVRETVSGFKCRPDWKIAAVRDPVFSTRNACVDIEQAVCLIGHAAKAHPLSTTPRRS